MKVKDRCHNDITLNFNVDRDKQIVTLLTENGLFNIPILTWGMSKEEGCFVIIDERYLQK